MKSFTTLFSSFFLTLGLGIGLFCSSAQAAGGHPPVVDAAAIARAQRISAMPDTDPVARMCQLLDARDLDDAALFALAATHPGLVEEIVGPTYKLAMDYINSLPAPEIHRIRRGETVIRTKRVLRGIELDNALALNEHFDFKEKKFDAIRVGPLESRIFRVEVTAIYKKNKPPRTGAIEMAWPSTPERDEASRSYLTKYFGARPSRTAFGAGSVLPLLDGSFEATDTLTSNWEIIDGVMLGTDTPIGEVVIDNTYALDGSGSLRFYSSERTRLFPAAIQKVAVQPGTHVRARAQLKTENVRVEFQQRDDDLYLAMSFLDASGRPIGSPLKATGRLSTHTWELLEVQGQAPAETASVEIKLLSAISGDAWFDGVTLEVVQ